MIAFSKKLLRNVVYMCNHNKFDEIDISCLFIWLDKIIMIINITLKGLHGLFCIKIG